jgi:hypothetical protein
LVLKDKAYQANPSLNTGKEMALQQQDGFCIMASQDITPEEAEHFEVECGFCSKIITVRSLEAHIMAYHSKEYD